MNRKSPVQAIEKSSAAALFDYVEMFVCNQMEKLIL